MASVIKTICLNILKYLILTWCYLVRLCLMIRCAGQTKIIPPVRNELLLISATKMAEQIREGKVKSLSFVSSYIDRIEEVNPFINAMTEDMFGQALAEAKRVDLLIESRSKTVEQIAEDTPLLGVPITVKFTVEVEGTHSTGGSKFFENRFAKEDANVVKALKKAGAIIIATSNAPEFCSTIDTWNKLYGSTKNPYDTTKSAGGSSGGEAALIASACSVLGIGSDMAGSLRVPAAFCGIFTHKSTKGMISERGHFPEGIESLVTLGPMCRYAEDLLTSMKILSGTNKEIMKLDDPVDLSNIKVFYMENDSDSIITLPVESDILRGLQEAASELGRKFNAKPEKLQMKSMRYAFFCSVLKIHSSFEKPLKDHLLGEGNNISIIAEILKSLLGHSTFTSYILILFCLDIIGSKFNMTEQALRHVKAIEEDFGSILDENSVLLMPTYPLKSFYCGESVLLCLSMVYSPIFNILGLPVTQCPLGLDENRIMPVGIQIVASKGNDRLAIQCAIELEKIFGGWRQPNQRND